MARIAVLIALIAAFLNPDPCKGDEVIKGFVGAQGIFYDDQTSPGDFEAGGTVRASLSPHISAVGGVFYGVDNSYIRGSAGVRFTVTDVDNRDFSVGVGLQRHASSEPSVRSEEWIPDVTIGWKPYPLEMPRVIVLGSAGYGLDTSQALVTFGLRWELGGGR